MSSSEQDFPSRSDDGPWRASDPAPRLRLLPLGGLGEIGMNTLLLESGDDLVCIDCGVMFAQEPTLGVDVLLPDLRPLLEKRHKLRGYLLTHGHEDHIGALPYALRQAPAPVYGSPFTLAVLREKLAEHRIDHGPEDSPVPLRPLVPRVPFRLGELLVEPLRVTHSFPDAFGLLLETRAGRVVHTGDFKIDHTPIDGVTTDLYRLAALGDEGVALLLSDSTNVERPGHVASEREIGAIFEEIFARARGRVIVTLFASHVHRIQQIARVAVETGRHIAFEGRSLQQNVRLARDLGLLHVPSDRLLDLADLVRLGPEQQTLVVTGSQGEARSALSRMAHDDHPLVRLLPGDTVVFSARAIPGNERGIARLVDRLYRRGARVVYEALRVVHTSGHAAREELKLMIRLCRPRAFLPVHGAYRHLVLHAELARELGVPHGLVAENGDVIELREDGSLARAGHLAVGRFFVDTRGEDVAPPVVRDRQALSQAGVVTVVVMLDRETGELVRGPELYTRGLYETEPPEVMAEAQRRAAAALKELSPDARTDTAEVEEALRRALRGYFRKLLERKPVVVPIVMEM